MCSGAECSSRLPRTVHCSLPRDTPPKPSMMPRFWYLPRPKSTCSDPSVRAMDTQIFSVQASIGLRQRGEGVDDLVIEPFVGAEQSARCP